MIVALGRTRPPAAPPFAGDDRAARHTVPGGHVLIVRTTSGR
ncbi:hypothetical protein [Streptosporangium longisporum]